MNGDSGGTGASSTVESGIQCGTEAPLLTTASSQTTAATPTLAEAATATDGVASASKETQTAGSLSHGLLLRWEHLAAGMCL
eukprot:CAMPEP_0206607584 /NCGR_PEP_ID=MMETSP0325_2-20121206/52303_1 /ASSEMBLY_ACC=CAM_ASM_000347 /TAXON_ID=2866 /ORGANISM="Crypthecodinium cohnii, Strain Seligo" /LENGTH=81 /DNA_ID=CAMNT_0054124757 /DNA_START=15 /DNA_END=257 /DNA_ORIENTATION=+